MNQLKELYGQAERPEVLTKVKITVTGLSVKNEKTGKFEITDVKMLANSKVYPIGQTLTAFESKKNKAVYFVKLGNDLFDIIPKGAVKLAE